MDGNAQSAFQQLRLLAGERPGVGKALASVIAGEDDDGVFGQPIRVQGLQHATDLPIHGFDHSLIGLLRSTVEIEDSLAPRLGQAHGLSFVARALPRPVWRVEV